MTWRCNALRGRPSIWTVWRTRTLKRTCRPARYTSYTPQRIRLKLTVDTMTSAVTRSEKLQCVIRRLLGRLDFIAYSVGYMQRGLIMEYSLCSKS